MRYYLITLAIKIIVLITAIVAVGKITIDPVLANYETSIALTIGICAGYAFNHFDNIWRENEK